MKISVIGTGYVGLVSGTCFADMGYEVMCIDVDKKKIDMLKKGILPIYEPGLEELVLRNSKEGRLHFSTDIKSAVDFADIVISAVGTPTDKNHRADIKSVIEVAKSFGENVSKYTVFVTKSTVPVGTNEMCKEIISKEIKKRNVKVDFDIVSNPEFLREGCAIKDTITPDRIVVGVESEKAKKMMEKLYKPIVRTGKPLMITDIKSAEVIKYAANSFLATKISFINEMSNFCECIGADITEVAKGIGLDGRIGSRFLHAGIGYGGSCFPKDVQALIQKGKEVFHNFKILEAVEEVNARQKERLFIHLKKVYPNLNGKKIAMLGLSFKPKTDDMRDAPSLVVIKKLLDDKAEVSVFDPVAMNNTKIILKKDEGIRGNKVIFAENVFDCVRGADAVMLLTEWDEFRALDLKKIKELMKGNLLIDGRNVYDKEDVKKAGLEYISIGRAWCIGEKCNKCVSAND